MTPKEVKFREIVAKLKSVNPDDFSYALAAPENNLNFEYETVALIVTSAKQNEFTDELMDYASRAIAQISLNRMNLKPYVTDVLVDILNWSAM